MEMKQVAEGFTILKRYGRYGNACWILETNGEAAIVEMPMYSPGQETAPWERAESYTRRRKLHVKYAFLSHGHVDHCKTLPQFRLQFPDTTFVAHRSLVEDRQFLNIMARNPHMPLEDWVSGRFRLFDELFDGPLWSGELGGEPVHLIHAPKHSYTDLLIVFRGAMITGDWFLGDLRDCNSIVKPPHKVASIENAARLVRGMRYHVHMLFSAHGDCLMYGVDFFEVMRRSQVAH